MRPGIRDAVVPVGILFFLAKCAPAAPAPALEKDDLFAPYAEGVPKVTTVISEETKDGVKVTKLRFASAEGSKEGEVKDCEIYAIIARPANTAGQKLPGMLVCHGGGMANERRPHRVGEARLRPAAGANDSVRRAGDLLRRDQRPVNAIGRPTANADANPEGVLRIGVCFEEVDGKPVARALSLPELPAEALSLVPAGPDAWTLKVTCAPAGPCLGVSVRVTDNTEFKFAATPLFWLTGRRGTGQEQMGFVQLGAQDEGVLYRIGY